MDVAQQLRSVRQRAGLTQVDLAARAGTSQTTLSAYENGRKHPSLGTLDRLLSAAGAELVVRPRSRPVIRRSRADHRRTARELGAALALAEALPRRPPRTLRYPRLPTPA